MHQYYDYCDTYDSYENGLSLDRKNSVKTFWCDECKQSKFILKKSIAEPKFKCEECIQKKEAPNEATASVSTPNLQNPDIVLNLPVSSSFQASSFQASSLQASPAMLTMDGMYQQYQPYQLQQPQEQQEPQQGQQEQQGQQGQQSQQATFDTTPQFSWRWFNFFV